MKTNRAATFLRSPLPASPPNRPAARPSAWLGKDRGPVAGMACCAAACGVLLLFAAPPVAAASFSGPTEVLNSTAGKGASGAAAGDLDLDGKVEYVTAGSSSSSSNHFRIYKHTSGTSFQVINIGVSNPAISGRRNRWGGDLEMADMNGDGWLDIVVPESWNKSSDGGGGAGGRSGRLTWFENPDGNLGGTWTEHIVHSWNGSDDYSGAAPTGASVEHLSELAVGDVNADGRMDIVVRDIRNGFWVFMQQAAGTEGDSWNAPKFVFTYPREGLDLADIDLDGDLDVVLNGVWYETPSNPATGTYNQHAYSTLGWYPSSYNHAIAQDNNTVMEDYASKVLTSDFNNDGRVDIVITNGEELQGGSATKPRGVYVYLAPADPVNGTWTQVQLHNLYRGWHNLAVADVDQDGDWDVVAGISSVGVAGSQDSTSGQIYCWINNGQGSFSQEAVNTGNLAYQAVAGDADGDGDPDLLAAHHFNQGAIRYFQNTTPPLPPGGFDAFSQIEAEDFTSQTGLGIYSGGTGQKIGSIENGTWASYANVDFGTGAASFSASVASNNASGGTIEIRLDAANGALVGSVAVPYTGGWNNFTSVQTAVSGVSGVHDLYLVFTGGSGALLDVDHFQFGASSGNLFSSDIGSPAIAGSASENNGVFTIQAGGTDIWGTSDQFHYVYESLAGDGEVLARVQSITQAHLYSKAGVMMRETLDANSKHATTLVHASGPVHLQRRATTGGSSAYTNSGSGLPHWVRLVRAGDTFTSYRSTDGASWTLIDAVTISMTQTIYVGMAVTSHNASQATTAIIDNYEVTGSGSPQSIDAEADTFVQGSAPTTAYGTASSLAVKDGAGTWVDRISYLRFPLSGTVTSATLKLKVTAIGAEGSGSRTVEVRQLSDDSWTEAGTTWNNRPATNGTLIATIDAATVGQVYSVDVTAYVNAQAGDGKASFVLVQPADVGRYVGFGSRESADKPILEVQ